MDEMKKKQTSNEILERNHIAMQQWNERRAANEKRALEKLYKYREMFFKVPKC